MLKYYTLIILTTLLFLYGFFPVNRNENIFDTGPPLYIENHTVNIEQLYSSNVKQTVIIVIDALRLDFVNPNFMPLLSNLAESDGCISKVSVETPTVTLPRIKALTSGNVPQFVDLILNLASTEILTDSIIHSAYKKNDKIVFYGDDTWLKLFPNYFLRSEGTTSFYVKDFREVDDNVTRNVDIELENRDWNIMILHYLGLDHIGHVLGPKSSLVPPKLREMDEIIHSIYTSLQKTRKNPLVIVTGDHGMRDSGGHGGSTYPETNVPLVILGTPCDNGSFAQTDIPVNLAALLALNIPSTSIGRIQRNLLKSFSLEKYIFSLRYNTLHLISKKPNLCGDHFDLATKYHIMYNKNNDTTNAEKAIELYKSCSELISNKLMKSSIKQKLDSLMVAILILVYLIIKLLEKILSRSSRDSIKEFVEVFFLHLAVIFQFILVDSNLYIFLILLISFIIIRNLAQIQINIEVVNNNSLTVLVIATLVHPLTFFSSSFIEEEHEFWYFSVQTFCLINVIHLYKAKKNKFLMYCWLSFMMIFRISTSINQTGDKWAQRPDFSDWLLQRENYFFYQLWFVFGILGVLYYALKLTKFKSVLGTVLNVATLMLIFMFKNIDYETVVLGRIIWGLILFQALFSLIRCDNLMNIWLLITALLVKPYNIILIPSCLFASRIFHKTLRSVEEIILIHVFLGNALYFAQGHSNSLASIDVSVGYIGLDSYQPLFVVAQVLSHSYAFPILCHSLMFNDDNFSKPYFWKILFFNRLTIFIIVCIVTLIHRHHLFIWSVFAPKLFIESSHISFLFIEYCAFNFIKIVTNLN